MIQIRHLVKKYFNTPVVDDVSLQIDRGTVFGFLGQNGAGKTTVMKIIVGLARPDEGLVTIEGQSPENAEVREKIGYMPEGPYFYDRLTGMEFLKFCAALFDTTKGRDGAWYEEILRTVGIYEARDRQIATYSKGMRTRLGFAQTLVNDPAYVFLDEPLDGLDPLGRKEIKGVIKKLHAQGKTIFFNSHILYDTEELCDNIGIIDKGKILYSGPVKSFCKGSPLEEKFVSLVESRSLIRANQKHAQ